MTVDQSSELSRLRAMARDLLALSTIPQAWVGREALAIAGGLADVLIDSLDLDFVFVRFRDPIEGDAIEVTRGNSAEPFPDWLTTQIGEIGHLSRTETLTGGDGAEPYSSVAIPLGVNAEGGLVVAACRRTDFPNETDRLLLPVASNHAATAFQNACLRKQLNAKVEELGHAHDVLEVRVVERTAELNVANEELSALRRVATLVAQEASQSEVFSAIAQEIALLLGFREIRLVCYDDDSAVVVAAWGSAEDVFAVGAAVQLADDSAVSRVFQTGQPVRIDDYAALRGPVADAARSTGVQSVVAWPISVGGRLWGALTAGVIEDELPPPETESHLGQFTELMATAIANSEARGEVERLAEDQSALRRVATLVAEAAPPAEIFSAVSNEVATLFHTEMVVVGTFDGDPVALLVVGVGDGTDEPVVGSRWKLDDALASTAVYRTGLPARFDHDSTIADPDVAAVVERFRPSATVAVPIKVEGRLWGAMIVSTRDALLPMDTEERLQKFTDLVATALANAEARAEVHRLADEQAALRRVATLVAGGTEPDQLFAAVADEVQRLLGGDASAIVRFEDDGTVTTVGTHAGPYTPGTRREPEPNFVVSSVRETRRAARFDTDDPAAADMPAIARDLDIRSAVASPIVVEGELWGAIVVASRSRLPQESEARLGDFTDLVATAVANAQARQEVSALADEQAALRRVATLVADGTEPDQLFAAVADEVQRLLGTDASAIGRFEDDGTVTTVGTNGVPYAAGTRRQLDPHFVGAAVRATRRAARFDTDDPAAADMPAIVRDWDIRSAVASPIVVEGELWGVIVIASRRPLPQESEARLGDFTDLVATAIANAEGSAQLAASRRRIVAASDEARRRIERDLHDGVQQQLVSVALELGMMKADPPSGDALRERLTSVTEDAGLVLDALLETARGIHPAILSQGGLAAALRALARRSAVPVKLHAQIDGPLPDDVEVAAYYVAAEALTNAAKHAQASVVHLDAATADGAVRITVRDDGVGGASPGKGSGLVGLQDRVEALGGTIKIDSSAGSGTCIVATLPIATEPDRELDNVLGRPQQLGSPTSPA